MFFVCCVNWIIGDRWYIIIKCDNKVSFVEKQIGILLSKIDNNAYSLSIGVTSIIKTSNNSTFKDAYQRALNSLSIAKEQVRQSLLMLLSRIILDVITSQ